MKGKVMPPYSVVLNLFQHLFARPYRSRHGRKEVAKGFVQKDKRRRQKYNMRHYYTIFVYGTVPLCDLGESLCDLCVNRKKILKRVQDDL